MYSFKTFDATNSEAATGRNPLYKTMSTPIFKKRKRQPSQSSGKLPFQMSTKSHASILTRVKMRKINEDIKVTPEIASQVVKEYLMPMFELEGRNIAAKSRSSLMGVNSKEMPERVVKCKLSDIILKQLNLTKEELENLNKR